jgi:hypothetical protein
MNPYNNKGEPHQIKKKLELLKSKLSKKKKKKPHKKYNQEPFKQNPPKKESKTYTNISKKYQAHK